MQVTVSRNQNLAYWRLQYLKVIKSAGVPFLPLTFILSLMHPKVFTHSIKYDISIAVIILFLLWCVFNQQLDHCVLINRAVSSTHILSLPGLNIIQCSISLKEIIFVQYTNGLFSEIIGAVSLLKIVL